MDYSILRNARIARGYSQENLAEDIGLSQSQYSRRESGAIEFNLKELSLICEALDLNLVDVISKLMVANDLGIKNTNLTNSTSKDHHLLSDLEEIVRNVEILATMLRSGT